MHRVFQSFIDRLAASGDAENLSKRSRRRYFGTRSELLRVSFAAIAKGRCAQAAVTTQQPPLARAIPTATGVVILIAGALQLTAWKARYLARCREAPGCGRTLPADAGMAWRHFLATRPGASASTAATAVPI